MTIVESTDAIRIDAEAIAAHWEEMARRCREKPRPGGGGGGAVGGGGPRGGEIGGQATLWDVWWLVNDGPIVTFGGQDFANLTSQQNRRVSQCTDRFMQAALQVARSAIGRARPRRRQPGRGQSRPGYDSAEVQREKSRVQRQMRALREQHRRCLEAAVRG